MMAGELDSRSAGDPGGDIGGAIAGKPAPQRSVFTVFDLLGLFTGVFSAVMILRDTVGSGNWIVWVVHVLGAVVMIPVAWLVVRLLFQVLILLVLTLAPVGREPDPSVNPADLTNLGATNMDPEPRPGRAAPSPPSLPDEADSR